MHVFTKILLLANYFILIAEVGAGRRSPLISAKGPQTIDAPFSLLRLSGCRKQKGVATRQAQTRPSND